MQQMAGSDESSIQSPQQLMHGIARGVGEALHVGAVADAGQEMPGDL